MHTYILCAYIQACASCSTSDATIVIDDLTDTKGGSDIVVVKDTEEEAGAVNEPAQDTTTEDANKAKKRRIVPTVVGASPQ
jgi:hypothetical protein